MRNDPEKDGRQTQGLFAHQWGKPANECAFRSLARLGAYSEAEDTYDDFEGGSSLGIKVVKCQGGKAIQVNDKSRSEVANWSAWVRM